MITSHSGKNCSLHCNIQTKVRHKSSLLLNERAQCSFKVSGNVCCCWASHCGSSLNGLVCHTQPPSSDSFCNAPPSCMTPLAVSYLQKYFCCAVLSCSLSYNYLFPMCDFNMRTNSLDQTKCSPVFVKEKQIMGNFMAFSCKTGSFHRSPEPAWDGCPSGSRSFLKECIWLSSCSL